MALAPFFDRVSAATTGRLMVTRESLEMLLGDTEVSVVLPSGSLRANTCATAELAVNLLARLFPRINVVGDPAMSEDLATLAKSINPSVEIGADPAAPQFRIYVDGGKVAPPKSLVARADGWVASVTAGPAAAEPPGPENGYASGVAACLAVAEIVRRAFGRPSLDPGMTNSVSLLDFSPTAGRDVPVPAVDLGEAAFVGLGAVGQAALWALGRHASSSGRVWLVDDEDLDLSNLQRYVLGRMSSVGRAKTELAFHALAGTGLECLQRKMTLTTFASEFAGDFRVPTVCVSVDNIEARRGVQALLPRLVVNGFTGTGSLGVSWHRFVDDRACLACLYHPRGALPSQADLVGQAFGMPSRRAAILLAGIGTMTAQELETAATKLGLSNESAAQWKGKPIGEFFVHVVCGGADVPIPGRGHSETVPLAHQSALAGILLAAELVKRVTHTLEAVSQRQTLAVWNDVLRPHPRSWVEPRPREAGCICGDPVYQQAYADKWA